MELTGECEETAVTIRHQDGDEDQAAEEENVCQKYNLRSGGDPHLTRPAATRPSQGKTPHYYCSL